MQSLSDWDVEDFLSCLPSPPAVLNVFSNSDPCLVQHDHTYSLSQEHVSIDLGKPEISEVWERRGLQGLTIHICPFADNESYEKERAQMTPLRVEEPADQVLDLIYRRVIPVLRGSGQYSALLSEIPLQLCCPPLRNRRRLLG